MLLQAFLEQLAARLVAQAVALKKNVPLQQKQLAFSSLTVPKQHL
jgi:hypothetical protein